MRTRIAASGLLAAGWAVVSLSAAASGAVAASGAAQSAECDAQDGVSFVCGPVSPEDLVAVPESPWVVVSTMETPGYLSVADRRDFSTTQVWPPAGAAVDAAPQRGGAGFDACPGPVEGAFQPHGLSLRAGEGGVHTLYVVRHGAREAVEVFELDASAEGPPAVTWVGCAVAPEGVSLNSVAALPGGGFGATNFNLEGGQVWEWQPDAGWSEAPGSATVGPNGLTASPDGRWFYVGGWGTQSLIRLSRGQTPVQVDSVPVGFHVDNVRLTPDGAVLAAGHTGEEGMASIIACVVEGNCASVTSRVAVVDPEALSAREVVNYPSTEHIPLGTVALQVGDEIWVGGIGGGDRIARFPVP